MRRILAFVAASAVVAAVPAQAQSGMTPAERAEFEALRQRLAELESQVAARAQADAQQQQQAAQAAQAAASRPADSGGGGIGSDHNLELYGFAQVDLIQDFNRVNPSWDATLRPSKIPTTEGQFGSDGQFIASARQSRLGVKADGTIAGKPYEAKFEFDLYGVGVDEGQTTFRLRHAYAKWGPILAGQTNTLFMDGDIFPNVVDYWGPAGMVFIRNPQIALTLVNGGGWTAKIGLEQPNNDVDPGSIRLVSPEVAENLRGTEELPDLTGQVRYGGDWGHVQLAGVLRKVGYDTAGTPDNEPSGSELGWGLNGTTVLKFAPVTFRGGVVYGEGIASYMNDGGMDLAPSAQLGPVPPIFPPPPVAGTLLEAQAVELLGVTGYIEMQWTDQLTSALGYSFTQVDNTNFQDPTAFHRGEYASVNLLWQPESRLLAGIELLWGQRTDNDGAQGDDLRLQTSFKASFSSKDIWGD
ncbi:DcaP family trimeric outer membrane transporter [Altererythrobacter sp. Root672]|uniref:DcaP family trimeric outer membrane transporter n=1 Tax=Altererythrobacter sp. Root672 TaxID=1736584 RepID=UPI000A869D80|nr:DcaP family trimeric outer membrane transporter [Altererythrobacter sp. Root672]